MVMDNYRRTTSVASENCTLQNRSGIKSEHTKRFRPKQIQYHTDRKSIMQANIKQDKQIIGKGTRRALPVSTNIAQMLYFATFKSGVPAPSEIHVQKSGSRSKRSCSETRDSARLTTHKKLQSDRTKPLSKKSGIFDGVSRMAYELKRKSAWSSTQNPSCEREVSNCQSSAGEQPNKEVLGDLLKKLEEDDIKDERGVVGTVYDITSQGHNDDDADSFSTSEMQISCSTLEEARSDQQVESLREEEDTSDGDSQYDTDLEEEFKRSTPNLSSTGRELYESVCKKKGITPASFLQSRFTCPKVLMPHHGLGPEGGKALAKALMVNTHIEVLDLSDNDLRSAGGASMACMLYENCYISDLDLSENELGTSAGIEIAKVMVINNTVRRLVLRGNNFNDKVAMAFAKSLKENRRLNILDLSYNKIGEAGGLYLGAGLSLNYGLTILNVKWNFIRGKGAIALAHALGTNETLKSLDLSWNSLGYKGAMALSAYLLKNETLKHLDLRNNHLDENAALRLAPTFAKHSSLEDIKLGQNPIGQEGIKAIFEAVVCNPRIRHIGLEDISVPVKFLSVIEKLKAERDAEIITDKKTRLTITEPEKDGMDILIEFLNKNSLRLKDMFFRLDKDRSGDISRSEFKLGLKEMGIPMDSRQLDKLIKEIDKDKNNKIDYSEILGGHKVARLEKRRQTIARLEIQKMEQAALLLPEMDIIKRNLSLKRP